MPIASTLGGFASAGTNPSASASNIPLASIRDWSDIRYKLASNWIVPANTNFLKFHEYYQ